MKWFLLIIIGLAVIILGPILLHEYVTSLVKRFGWTIPDDCFLIITNSREYQDTTLCYYVKTVEKIYDNCVEFNGCLIDMNNPEFDEKKKTFSKLRIPRAWILSRKTKIRCFDTETLKNYIQMLKNNANTNGQFS